MVSRVSLQQSQTNCSTVLGSQAMGGQIEW